MRIQNENLQRFAESTPGTIEFKKAKAAAIKRGQIERCYRQYSPPQILEMQRKEKLGY